MRNQPRLSYLLPLSVRSPLRWVWVGGVLRCWHTEGFSVRRRETALPGQSACLINNTRGSGRTMRLKHSKCGPRYVCLSVHTHVLYTATRCLMLSHSYILYTQTLGLSFSPFLSLSMIKKQYPAYNCKLVRHPHSFAVKGKWPWWWVTAFTQRFALFKSLKAEWSSGSRHCASEWAQVCLDVFLKYKKKKKGKK